MIKVQTRSNEWDVLCYDSLVNKRTINNEEDAKNIEQLNTQIISEANIVLFCYSSNDLKSFENLKQWHQDISTHLGPNTLIYLVATKSDLDAKISDNDIEALKNELAFEDHFKTCASNGTNIESLFDKVVRKYEQVKLLASLNTTGENTPSPSHTKKAGQNIFTYTPYESSLAQNVVPTSFQMAKEENIIEPQSCNKQSAKELMKSPLFVDIDDIELF